MLKPPSGRRAGYLWLGLNLRPEDELSLLHVNSIVKASRTAEGVRSARG